MKKEELERKLKRERVEVCLNCKKFIKCDDIGRFEECADFEEVEDQVWIDKKGLTNCKLICPCKAQKRKKSIWKAD